MSRKILVVKLGGIGDVLAATPAFRALRKKNADAHISLIVGEWSKGVVENNPFIDELIVVDENIFWKKRVFSLAKLFYKLRRQKYDIVYVLHWSKLFNIFAYLLGIHERIGFDREGDGVLLTRKYSFQEETKGMHRIERYLQMVTDDYINKDHNMRIYLSEDELGCAKKDMGDRDIIGIAPGGGYNPKGSMNMKQWPAEYYVELVSRIHSELNMPVMLFGGESDMELGKQIESGIRGKGKVFNHINRDSLRVTSAYMSFCRLVVANDSGPAYMAASVGTPTIGIFGPTAPYDKVAPEEKHRYLYKNTPVTPSTTVSRAPPLPYAITGLPHACTSTGTMPKSSSPGNIRALHLL